MPTPNVIFYRYDGSPFSTKLEHILLLKKIPHLRVNVSPLLPRPEITDLLGLNYRRIPILAVGNDIYCDTSLIATALERHFPSGPVYGTLFPPRKGNGNTDAGLIKTFAKHYSDDVLFRLFPVLLPWENFPEAFVKDRSALMDMPIRPEAMKAASSHTMVALSSHLSRLEEQLSDGREWLFDTELPSLADISVHQILFWFGGPQFRGAHSLLEYEKTPCLVNWIGRMKTHLAQLRQQSDPPRTIDGSEAAARIAASPSESSEIVGYDRIVAKSLGIPQPGAVIEVRPTDSGAKYPTNGRVLGINHEEIVIETQGREHSYRCHFPIIGFSVKSLKSQL